MTPSEMIQRRDEGYCIACPQPREEKNSVFCKEHYQLFRVSWQFADLEKTYDYNVHGLHFDTEERQRARLEAWLSFANEHHRYFCLCGRRRNSEDYLCPPCRESYANAA